MKNLKERLITAVDSILVEELEILHILYGMQIIPCKKEHTMTNTEYKRIYQLPYKE